MKLKKCKLGEVINLKRGYDLPYHARIPGSIPIISSSGITDYHIEAKVKGPGVVTGRYGTLGELFYVEEDYWPLNTTLYVEDFKENDPKYIYYLLQTLDFAKKNDKTSVPGLNRNDLHLLDVYIPENPEDQVLIASILSSLDEKIELNQQMNFTLESMAQAIFKHWFIDFDFPDENGKPYKSSGGVMEDSVLGGIPKGWRSGKIKEVGTVITGNTPPSKDPEQFGNDTAFITPTDFKNYGKYILHSIRGISLKGVLAQKSRIIPANSVVVTCIGSDMGKVAINTIECLTNQQINSIKINNDVICSDYIYYCLIQSYAMLRNMATGGSTMPIINKSDFENINLIIPPPRYSSLLAEILSPINNKIISNTKENFCLAEIRESILPKLINGELIATEAEALNF